MKFFLYFAICAGFLLATYRLKWLSFAGAATAAFFGFSLLVLGGAAWIAPVLFFFATSSILSKINKITSQDAERGEDVRDAWQVLSNGGVAWGLLLLSAFNTNALLCYVGFAGALAAATADTWGTELGRLGNGVTRSILTGRVVSRGTSGGMSWQGTLGGAIGAGLIGGIAWYSGSGIDLHLFLCIALAGIAGSLADSLLGAAVQARYQNQQTGEVSEYPDERTHLISGLRWMDNNMVNCCCTLAGAVAAMVCWYFR
ncbi:MAG: DUF92 domain-containing protein [Bacteroidota bacterium]